MRIHILINCYWGSAISGGDRRVLELMRRWVKTDYILVYTSTGFANIMEKEGIVPQEVYLTDSVKETKKSIIVAYFLRTLGCIKALRLKVKQGDIIYSPTDILPDVIPAITSVQGAKWCVVTHHIYEDFYKRPGNIIRNFISCMQQKVALFLARKHSDVIITPSPVVYNCLINKQRIGNLVLSGNGVDFDVIDSINASPIVFDAAILCRLSHSKGIFELPEVWRNVVKEHPFAKLAIMGGGNEETIEELNRAFFEMGIADNVDIMGFVTTERAFSILKSAKLFVFTSHEEGWGIAIAEAMACGIPVVAYDLPVYRDIFPEGILVCDIKDTAKMAGLINDLLSCPQKCVELGEKGMSFVRKHYALDALAQTEYNAIVNG